MKRIVIGACMGLLLGGIAATAAVMAPQVMGGGAAVEGSLAADTIGADSLAAADSLGLAGDSLGAPGTGPDSITMAALRAAALADSLQLARLATLPDSITAPAEAGAQEEAPATLQPGPATLDGGRLAKLLSSMQPREAARVLVEMEDAEIQVILSHLRDRQAAAILSNLPPQRVAGIGRSVLRTTGSRE